MSIAETNAPASTTTPRLALLLAVLIDTATLGLALLAATAVAAAFLLLRTEAGRIDPPFRDAAAALVLCAAVVPAWTAWQWRALMERGTTAGGGAARLGGTPVAPPGRLVRLALHPVSIPAWYWLAATVAILAAPGGSAVAWLAAGVALVATLLVVLGLASLVLLLARPGARPLHARIGSRRHEGRS